MTDYFDWIMNNNTANNNDIIRAILWEVDRSFYWLDRIENNVQVLCMVVFLLLGITIINSLQIYFLRKSINTSEKRIKEES